MSRRDRVAAALVVALLHFAVFVPTIGSSSSIIDRGFSIQADRILDGEKPYSEVDFEYPPLALPLVSAPAAVSEGLDGYQTAFETEMLLFDLGIVALLALALPATRRRVWEALGIYSAGVIAVSGVVLADSRIESAPLALARFDLALALLMLAALFARKARRSALWGGLLGTATAIKAFPAMLFPNLFRDEAHPRRAIVAVLIPIATAAALVLVLGDEFGSAITYHSERDLQIETLGATPLLIAHLLWGADAGVATGAGGYNLVAPGADFARTVSIVLLSAGVLFLIYEGWRRRTPPLIIATAILTTALVLAPVLSPQFLLWVLPISAAAYGLGRENVVLLACFVLTQVMLQNYDGVERLSGDFVWTLSARNGLLLVYLAFVVIPVFREQGPAPAEQAPPPTLAL